MLRRRDQWLLFLPFLLVVIPFLILPALIGIIESFTNDAPGQSQPVWVGIANYAAVVADPIYRIAWRNILIFILIAVPCELAIGFVIAGLLREPFRGRGWVRVALLLPWLVSPIGNGVMWYFLFNLQEGMVNFALSWLRLSVLPSPLGLRGVALLVMALTEIWRNTPLVGFLLLPGILAIPRDNWDIATLEGASRIDRARWILWPRIRPLFLAVALILTGDALGAFDTVLILTGGGPGNETLTPALYSYQLAFQSNAWPAGSTSAWFIVLGVVLVGAIYLWMTYKEEA